MTCHDAREGFSALVDDALAAGERAALEAHLATCGDCRRELQRFRATVSLLGEVAPVRAPAGFVDRVLEAARPAPWPRRLVRGLFLPWPVKLPMEAAAVVLVAVGVALVYRGSPELQQAIRQEPQTAVVARAPESTAHQTPAPVPPRETDGLRDQKDAGEPSKAEDQTRALTKARALGRTQEAKEAPAGKLVTPPAVAEQAPVGQNLQPPPPVPGARVDTSMAPAPRPPAVAGASAFAPSDVLGQLAVSDRDVALRQIGELITRLGAVESRRVDGSDGPILELTIPREGYAEFTRELARLGRWQPSREPSTLPAQVRVVLRITG
jgi:hypothetical protein